MSVNVWKSETQQIKKAAGNIDNKIVGDLSDLKTTDKTSVVNAVNEVNTKLDNSINDNVQNLLPNTASTSGIFTVNSDGSITVNGKPSSTILYVVGEVTLKANQTYCLNGGAVGFGLSLRTNTSGTFYKDKDNNNVSSYDKPIVFTNGNSDVKVYAIIGVTSSESPNFISYPMLEKGTVAHSYKPYKDSYVTIANPQYSNPNLLDNPWFTVNQRGAKTYTAVGYTVDRWVINSAKTTVKVVDSGLDISFATQYTSFAQKLEKERLVNGKTYTFSLMLSDGTIKAKTFTYKDDGNWYNIHTTGETGAAGIYTNYKYDTANNYIIIQVITASTTSASISMSAVKLELGTVSTLSNDVAPNYQQELAKCQRYCYVMDYTKEHHKHGYGFADMLNGTRARLFIPIPVKMRNNTPTLSSTDLANWQIIGSVSGDLIDSGKITKIELWYASDSEIAFTLTGTGLTYREYIFGYYDAADKLIVSADL